MFYTPLLFPPPPCNEVVMGEGGGWGVGGYWNHLSVYLFWFRSGCILWTVPPFLTKFGMAMPCHELECHAKSLAYYLQGQGQQCGLI